MSCKIKQHSWLLAVLLIVGLFMAIATDYYKLSPVLAQAKQPDKFINSATTAIRLEQQGKQFYTLHQFEPALDFWQQANTIYTSSGDILSRSRVLSNIALVYSQLGNWDKANQSIASSLNLLIY